MWFYNIMILNLLIIVLEIKCIINGFQRKLMRFYFFKSIEVIRLVCTRMYLLILLLFSIMFIPTVCSAFIYRKNNRY